MKFGFTKLTSFLKTDISENKSEQSILGIDIGASAIKFVQIHSVKNIPTLETYGELQLGPYEDLEIGRPTNLPEGKIIDALGDILREANSTGKQAVYALSYGSSFTSTILIPTIDPEQVHAMIPVEARKYVPTSLSRVTLDWLPLGIDKEENVTNVLLSAVYNEAQKRYESIMSASNLSVLGNEIEIFSTIRATVSPEDEIVAVIDCGASATRLYIVEKGVITKTHSVPLSGVLFTHALSNELGIPFDEAEEIKREFGILGTSDDPRIQKVLLKTLERGVRELHTVLKRHSGSRDIKIQKTVLSGGGALLQGITPYISDVFSLPVELADPFAKVAYPAFLEDTLKETGSSFAVAIGAALLGFQNVK